MKRLPLAVLTLIALLPVTPAGRGSQSASPYTYTVIHDLGGVTSISPFVPSINDAGQVAWSYQTPNYGGGAYRGDGTAVTTLFANSPSSLTTAPGLVSGRVSISNSGAVALRASSAYFLPSILVADGGVTLVANYPGAILDEPAINDIGDVVFSRRPNSTNDYSVQLAAGGLVVQIAGPGTSVPGGTLAAAWMPRINDSRQVAFYGRFPSGATNIFRFDGGVITAIGNGLLGSMNNLGEVAYWQHAYQGVVVGNGGPLRQIAKPPAGLRMDPSIASINDAGDVAFQVSTTAGAQVAAYVGHTTESWPVIEAGDDIPGLGTVLRVTIGNEALNNRGQVAMLVEYGAPGKWAIVRADPPDTDADDDGTPDEEDAFPGDPGESRDTDGDGVGDNADTDDDQDGQSDADEAACGSNPLDAGSRSADADGDGLPDCVDAATPPAMAAPASLMVEASSPAGAPVSLGVSAVDANGNSLQVICVPASGSMFPLGTTVVGCRAADAIGRSTDVSFPVTVVDGTRPTLTVITPDADTTLVDGPVSVQVLSTDAVGVATVTAWADATCTVDFATCSASTQPVSLQLSSGTAQSGTWTGQLTSPLLRRTLPYVLRVTVADAAGNQRSTSVFVDNDGIESHIDRSRADYAVSQSTVWSREFNTGTTGGTIHHETGLLSVTGVPFGGVRVKAEIVTPFLLLPPHGGMCTGRDKQFFLDATGETLDLSCTGDTVHARAVVARPQIVVRKLLPGQRCEFQFGVPRCEDRLYWVYAALPTGYGIRTGSPFRADADNPGPVVLTITRIEDDGTEVEVGTLTLDPGEGVDPEFVSGPVPGTELLVLTSLAGDIEANVGGVARTVPDTQTSTVTVRKAEQAITFPPLGNVAFGHAPIALGAQTSSGLPVTYAASGSCTVQGNMLTLAGVNACVVSASQAGDDLHLPAATVTRTFLVTHTWSGLLAPVSNGGPVAANAGRTIPVKFRLLGGSAGITTLEARLTVSPVVANGSSAAAAAGNGADGVFRYDPAADEYVLNWDTKGLTPGAWQLRIDLLDGVTRTALVHLR